MKRNDEVFVKITEAYEALKAVSLLHQQALDTIQEVVKILVEEYRDQVWRYCRGRLRNFPEEDVDDVCQEVFLEALKSLQRQTYDTQQGTKNMRAWLFGIASNRCNTRFEKASKSRETRISDNLLERGAHRRLEPSGLRLPLFAEFENIVQTFDNEQILIFVARKLANMTIDEIAGRFGLSRETARRRVRAIDALLKAD